MYVKNLRLQNIKCFQNIDFSFLKEDNISAKWVTLIGENATGKTTILQILGILLAGWEYNTLLMPSPDNWVQIGDHVGKCSIILRDKQFSDGLQILVMPLS